MPLSSFLHTEGLVCLGFRFAVNTSANLTSGAIWKAVAAMLPQEKLHFNSKVEAVYKDSRTIVLGNGDKHHYDLLLSSMPLHLLLKALSGEGTEPLKPYIEKFRWSASHIVGIGLKGR